GPRARGRSYSPRRAPPARGPSTRPRHRASSSSPARDIRRTETGESPDEQRNDVRAVDIRTQHRVRETDGRAKRRSDLEKESITQGDSGEAPDERDRQAGQHERLGGTEGDEHGGGSYRAHGAESHTQRDDQRHGGVPLSDAVDGDLRREYIAFTRADSDAN